MSEQAQMEGTADVQDHLEVRGGPPSFDEFEALHNTEVRDRQLEEASKTAEPVEDKIPKEVKKEQKAKERKLKKADKELEEEESLEASDSENEEKPEKESKAKEEKVEKSQKPSKMVEVKAGEETYKLPVDAVVPVKIDGKIEHKPLQEVLGGFSGQSSLDRKYSDLKKEQETFTKQRDALTKGVRKFHDLMVNQKDIRGGIEYIAEMMGADPQKTWEETSKSLQDAYGKISQMSDEEKQQWELQQQNAYYQRKLEEQATAKEQAAELQQLETQANEAMEKHGLTAEDLVNAEDRIKESKLDDYGLDDLVFVARHSKATSRVEGVLDKVAPELDERDKAVETLREELLRDDSLTDQDLEEIVTEVYATERAKRLSKKVAKSQLVGETAQRGPRNPQKDPLFWDDLD